MPRSSPTHYLYFSPVFVLFCLLLRFVVFYKYIPKQQEKYRVSRERYYVKYIDKPSEFLSFPTIYCGKTRVDNHLIIFKTTFPRVNDSLSLITLFTSLLVSAIK